MLPLWFQSSHTLPLPTAIEGWSTLPVPAVTGCAECDTAVGAQNHDWIVPNTPTNAAVLDIRFGCLNLYPETSSLQVQSAFVIGPAVN
jgi:hypothetical protein